MTVSEYIIMVCRNRRTQRLEPWTSHNDKDEAIYTLNHAREANLTYQFFLFKREND